MHSQVALGDEDFCLAGREAPPYELVVRLCPLFRRLRSIALTEDARIDA